MTDFAAGASAAPDVLFEPFSWLYSPSSLVSVQSDRLEAYRNVISGAAFLCDCLLSDLLDRDTRLFPAHCQDRVLLMVRSSLDLACRDLDDVFDRLNEAAWVSQQAGGES